MRELLIMADFSPASVQKICEAAGPDFQVDVLSPDSEPMLRYAAFRTAEAIIGETVSTAASAVMLEKSDIDYGVIDPSLSLGDAMKLVGDTRETGCRLPLVLTGDFDATDVPVIQAVGASGVATSRKLLQAADPVAAVRQLIEDLKATQN